MNESMAIAIAWPRSRSRRCPRLCSRPARTTAAARLRPDLLTPDAVRLLNTPRIYVRTTGQRRRGRCGRWHFSRAEREPLGGDAFTPCVDGGTGESPLSAPVDEVIERARAELIDLLNLRDCRYEPSCLNVEWRASTTTGTSSTWGWCGALTTWACLVPRSTCSSRLGARSWAASCSGRPRGTRSRSTAEWWRWLSPTRSAPRSDRSYVQPEAVLVRRSGQSGMTLTGLFAVRCIA